MTEGELWVDGQWLGLVRIADSRAARRAGLLGADTVEVPLWFPRTRAVHTAGMRMTIDVVFVDVHNTVLDVVTMRPWRLGRPRWRAAALLEASAGWAADRGISPGVSLRCTQRASGGPTSDHPGRAT